MRTVGAWLAVVACGAILAGVFTGGWWKKAYSTQRASAGLLGIEVCDGEACESRRYTELLEADQKAFVTLGRLTFGAGIIAGVIFAVAGALELIGRKIRGPVSAARLACAMAVVCTLCAVAFVSKAPWPLEDASVGAGMLLFFAGAALGGVGSLLVAIGGPALPDRQEFGVAPHSSTGASEARTAAARPRLAASAIQPACPQCDAPMSYVADHQKHFCSGCRIYACDDRWTGA